MEPGTFSPVHVAWVDVIVRVAFAILFGLSFASSAGNRRDESAS